MARDERNMIGYTVALVSMMIRLKKSAENDESPKNIVERMTADVEKFRGNAKRIDDAVMVVVKAIG